MKIIPFRSPRGRDPGEVRSSAFAGSKSILLILALLAATFICAGLRMFEADSVAGVAVFGLGILFGIKPAAWAIREVRGAMGPSGEGRYPPGRRKGRGGPPGSPSQEKRRTYH